MRILLQNLSYIATLNDDGHEIATADILIDGPVIASLGPGLSTTGVDHVIDGQGLIALPGLINAHQHIWQGVHAAVPALERAGAWDRTGLHATRPLAWWQEKRFGPSELREVARAVLLDALQGGVTTVADQHLFFPHEPDSEDVIDPWIEAIIEAAGDVGVRLSAGRGTMTRGPDLGGQRDERMVESVDTVVRHTTRLIEQYHDHSPFAMVRVAVAPCGVHLDVAETFEALADLASDHPTVGMHTHLYEKMDSKLALEQLGMSAWSFLREHGWANPRVWLGHVNDPPAEEIPEFVDAGVGLVHVPGTETRLGWTTAPVRDYLEAGAKVGFGTTLGAPNLLGNVRLAYLIHRQASADPSQWLTAREVISLATRGSAQCLGWPELGVLDVGRAADISCWRVDGPGQVGVHDPLMGLLETGHCDGASLVIVNGQVVVDGGQPVRVDAGETFRRARAAIPASH